MINPNKIDVVLYHGSCSDGFAAAYSAWKLLGNHAKYIPSYHGDPPPNVKGKNVAILDFSYKNNVIKQMVKDAASLIVIDHHKSAEEELRDVKNAFFDMNHSGAILAWNFFHPDTEPPKFIKYIEDRDLWKFKLPYSKEFSAAFDMVAWEFSDYEAFENDSVFDDAVERGSFILAYSKTVLKKIAGKAVHRKFEGLNVKVVNSSHWMSEIGGMISHDCDCAMVWYYCHETCCTKVSLRSFHDNIDVSNISKKFGGGGHKKSAGFILPKGKHIEEIFDVERGSD